MTIEVAPNWKKDKCTRFPTLGAILGKKRSLARMEISQGFEGGRK
jgi:hypothetical protein